jgi:hypothetical protein
MKKSLLAVSLAFAFVLSVSSVGWSGMCLDASSCNDYFLAFSPAESNVFSLHGYEYGCGYFDRISSGSMHLAGGNAYIGITSISGDSGAGDNGSLGNRSYIVDLSTYNGSYYYNYFYITSGAADGHGGSGSADAFLCGDPASVSQQSELDEMVPEHMQE